ncbi:class I tRNA ligase family protein [Promicromonospora iranensis]|uniref:leucine--tRNA ligase n=1 Tax=Promicromonospora iranensis TaxID=1105144 RepID=A0ABU2CPE7_9MICO|nr:class I tRNA ligase family protein [Promicromonospora iranensis]MDR7383215.1 leucyl-tRNA synthetase [Promicromonospora iranensis]
MSQQQRTTGPAGDGPAGDRLFEASDDGVRPRRYLLTMFPYPSGDLHMGHAEVFAITDVVARYWRAKGFDVLNPVGWDSFGLPAENAAIRRGEHPAVFTEANIATQAASIRRYGVSFDWSRRLHTHEPGYYRWTQWLFARMYQQGLAYRAAAEVNWCPRDRTVLANEQVVDGVCERCGTTVVRRVLTQWFFRITAYADRLLDDMTLLEPGWPPHVLAMQRNWIGRQEGPDGVRYRLHDWLVSRQRYWGAPVPVVHCPGCGEVLVPDDQLPVELPHLEGDQLVPGDVSPLAGAHDWVRTTCPRCGGPAERDTDTMDTFVDSSWYFLRYLSPGYEGGPFRPEDAARWMPAALYVGGVEHATMHLLYARFVTKVLYDMGLVPSSEPYARLMNQGQVVNQGKAMSKSLGNGVDLTAELDRHGVDAVRLAMLFAGPPEDDVDWADVSPEAMRKFLGRVLRLVPAVEGSTSGSDGLRRAVHRTVHDIDGLVEAGRFNVAVARLMELVGEVRRRLSDGGAGARPAASHEAIEAVAVLLSLFAPQTAQELWKSLGHATPVAAQPWPVVDPALLVTSEVVAVVQVDGKVRDRLTVPADVTTADLERAALARPAVARARGDRTVRRVVVRPPHLVNVVLGEVKRPTREL